MSKAALAGMLTARLGLKKAEGLAAVDVVLDGIQRVLLSRGSITFVGFGSFSLNERQSRRARNVSTGEIIQVPAKKVVKFTPGLALKDAIERCYPPVVATAAPKPKKKPAVISRKTAPAKSSKAVPRR